MSVWTASPESFKRNGSSGDNTQFGLIDWQMWHAGPPSNEFSQVWLNSFPVPGKEISSFEELMAGYHKELCELLPSVRKEYPLTTLLSDVKLQFVGMWVEYMVFSAGVLDGYKDPAQKEAKDIWQALMKRTMETMSHTGVLEELQAFAAKQ